MADGCRLSVVLPAFNEEGNVGEAIDRVTKVAERLCAEHEIIVVDDGSTDRTSTVVRAAAEADPRIRLVTHHRNRGYGDALHSGFRAARLDLVFVTDADNQFDPEEIEGFLPWIERVDVVAGYRMHRRDPPVRRIAATLWNWLVRILFYVPVRDIDCAFKLFRRSVLDAVDLESVGPMFNTELMVKLGRQGVAIVELGVTHFPRTAGRGSGISPKVVALAFTELFAMYRRLATTGVDRPLSPTTPPT
ncbi:MAG: glycosyltransferase family 2 protein [Actinomycetota bacterium]